MVNRSKARARRTGAARFVPATLFALALAFLLPVTAVSAQGPRPGAARGDVQCQKCHANREFLVGKASTVRGDSALFVPDSLLRDSRHAKLACADCHPGFEAGYPHNTTAIAVPCQQCHEKQGAEWAASIHAPNARTVGDAPTCVRCHGQHHVLGVDDPRSPTYALNVAKLCASCHNDPRIVGTYFQTARGAEARTAVAEYYKTVHGVAVTKAGLVVAATCNDCHGAHRILPRDSSQSTVNRANVAVTCGKCHAGVLATFDSSAHGQALAAGTRTKTGHHAPVCIDCHAGHRIVAANDSVWFRGVVSECGSCHERLYKTYFETYHGQVTELGFGLTAKCSDCHTAHAMLPPTDPRSSVNPANLVATCSRCHPGANARFVQYLPHGDPQDRARYPLLFWVWLFMTTLLVGVFSFFGLHTILWLLRLVLDRLRIGRPGVTGAEFHPGDGESAPGTLASVSITADSAPEPTWSDTREEK